MDIKLKKPTCVLVAPVSTLSGYGAHARGIADALIDWDKFDVKIISTKWGACPMTALDNNSTQSEKIKQRIIQNLSSQPELFVQVSIPNEFNPIGKYNVGITAGIETTVPRGEWVMGLNRMNLNIVPSKFSKEVFESVKMTIQDKNTGQRSELKMEKPMEIAFEGADESVYFKTDAKSELLDSTLDAISEDFVFLFVGHWLQGEVGEDRKNVGMLVKLFFETFKNKKNAPALLLKTSGANFSHMDKHDILHKINVIRETIVADTLPSVYVLHGDLTDSEMNRLYNHPKVKVNVSLTKGEGWGRPLLEASFAGKPIIASNWSGHLDFLPEKYVSLVPGKLEPIHPSAVNEWIIKEAQWFTPNYTIASKTMLDIFSNYAPYLKKAEELRRINVEKWSYKAGNDALISILDKYVPPFASQQQFTLPKFKKVSTPAT